MSLDLEHSILLASFRSQLFTCLTALWVTRKMNNFNKQTHLEVKHSCFIFKYYQNTFKHLPQLSTHTVTPIKDGMKKPTAAIVASVVTRWNNGAAGSFPINNTLSIYRPSANVLHQTCVAGLVKYLSTDCIYKSEWYLRYVLLPTENQWQNAVHHGMLSTATSPRVNDATVTSSWWNSPLCAVCLGFFKFWKLVEWHCFVAYLWNDTA